MVSINIVIDDSLHRQLKLHSIARKKTLKALITQILAARVAQDPLLKTAYSGNLSLKSAVKSSSSKSGGAR